MNKALAIRQARKGILEALWELGVRTRDIRTTTCSETGDVGLHVDIPAQHGKTAKTITRKILERTSTDTTVIDVFRPSHKECWVARIRVDQTWEQLKLDIAECEPSETDVERSQ